MVIERPSRRRRACGKVGNGFLSTFPQAKSKVNIFGLLVEAGLVTFSDGQIVDVYQQRFRGVAEYYKYAVDRCYLGKLKYGMGVALAKTLAWKFKTTVASIYKKYGRSWTISKRSLPMRCG